MSVRLRLTLINAAVLGTLLLVLGWVLSITTQGMVASSIDRDLRGRMDGFMHGPMMSQGIQSGNFQGGPNGPPEGFRPNGDQGPGTPGDRPPRPMPGRGPERPSFFNLQAKSPGQPNQSPLDPPGYDRARDGHPSMTTVQTDDGPVRVFSAPVFARDPDDSGKRPILGVGQVTYNLSDSVRLQQVQLQTLLVLVPIALVVSFVVGWFLTASALKPVEEVTTAALSITDRDLSTRLPVRGKDELARLSQTFNGMLERLEAAFKRQRQFTADASHELKTPIARVKLATSATLTQDSSPEEMHDALVVADQAADAMSRLTQQLLTLARIDGSGPETRKETVELAEIIEEAVTMVPHAGSRVKTSLTGELRVQAHPDELARVFVNLIDNAIRYSPTDRPIEVTMGFDHARIVASVIDHGAGVSPTDLPRLGERFYRVDSARSRKDGGNGLGLAIAKATVESIGGTLTFTETPGGGLTASVNLPVVS